jgi:hypothetical protein
LFGTLQRGSAKISGQQLLKGIPALPSVWRPFYPLSAKTSTPFCQLPQKNMLQDLLNLLQAPLNLHKLKQI